MRIAVFGKKVQGDHIELVTRLFDILEKRNAEVYICDRLFDSLKQQMGRSPRVSDFILGDVFEADYCISLGGDGSLLTTAKRVGDKQIPIIGINTGRLGFLTASDGNDLEETIDDLFEGRIIVENRSQLLLQTDTCEIQYPVALNDISIFRRDNSAMLHIHACVNGEYLNDYQADGLLFSTATGSTAYSLSIGGPILTPQNDSFIIVPIAPHSLTTRPLVLDGNDVVELKVESRNSTFMALIDGRSQYLPGNASVIIRKAGYCTKIVRRQGQTFINTLRTKMMWGRDARY